MFTHTLHTTTRETLINTAVSLNSNVTPNGSLSNRWCKGVKTRAPPLFSVVSLGNTRGIARNSER